MTAPVSYKISVSISDNGPISTQKLAGLQRNSAMSESGCASPRAREPKSITRSIRSPYLSCTAARNRFRMGSDAGELVIVASEPHHSTIHVNAGTVSATELPIAPNPPCILPILRFNATNTSEETQNAPTDRRQLENERPDRGGRRDRAPPPLRRPRPEVRPTRLSPLHPDRRRRPNPRRIVRSRRRPGLPRQRQGSPH